MRFLGTFNMWISTVTPRKSTERSISKFCLISELFCYAVSNRARFGNCCVNSFAPHNSPLNFSQFMRLHNLIRCSKLIRPLFYHNSAASRRVLSPEISLMCLQGGQWRLEKQKHLLFVAPSPLFLQSSGSRHWGIILTGMFTEPKTSSSFNQLYSPHFLSHLLWLSTPLGL